MKRSFFFVTVLGAFSVLGTEPSARQTVWAGSWSFEKTLADAVGNAGPAYVETPVFVPGVKGQALHVSSKSSVTVPDVPGLRLAPGFQIACRFRMDQFPEGNSWGTVAVKSANGEMEYLLRVNPASEGRHISFFVNTGNLEPRVSSREPAKLGGWYEVEAGWDGEFSWLTVNGQTMRVAHKGTPAVSCGSLEIGDFEGAIDELKVASPKGCATGKADWSFDGTLQDTSGHGHDFTGKNCGFSPVAGGQALRRSAAELSTSSTPDLQLSPGIWLDCSVFFKSLPKGITPIVTKGNEYMLRLDPQSEGNALSFFVNLDGNWEPRVRSEQRITSNTWYRVIAAWNGFELSIDVNGVRTKMKRSGLARPGNSPLVLGQYDGLLDNLRMESPKIVLLGVERLVADSLLLREGQSFRYSGTVRNYGNVVSGCVAKLTLPPEIVFESSESLDLGVLQPNCSRPVEWRLRANAPVSANAMVSLKDAGTHSFQYFRPLAVLPKADPDCSARAWNPPIVTNGTAATYYVDAIDGDNTRAGTSPSMAWHDFTNINGRRLGPGERLLIRRGSVINQELGFDARGSVRAWVEIGTYGEGARPIIRRNRDIDERCALFTNPDYLCIRGLTVCHAGKGLIVYYSESGHRGLLIEDCLAHHIEGLYRKNAHGIPEWRDRTGATGDGGAGGGIGCCGSLGEDIVLRDCEMFHCSNGFRFTGKNVFIDRVFCHDNYTHNTSPHPFLISVNRAYLQNSIFDASGWNASAGTMGIMLGGQFGLIIRNCHFLNQPDSGSHDEGGIDFEAGGECNLVDHCTFRNNAGAAIEMLGLRSPQTPNVEITRSRFDRDNVAHKLGPSEIFIWGGSKEPSICCSSGVIHDNAYCLVPGVLFFTNQAPALTRWTLTNNVEYASSQALDEGMPYDNPPAVDAGPEIWTDDTDVRLKGDVEDDGKPESGTLLKLWEVLDGPGSVVFRNPAKPSTKADFAAIGDYTLRLKADDGELWRSARTSVHILRPGTKVAKAWAFARPLDKEGWSERDLGTTKEIFAGQHWSTFAEPVHIVAGGEYIVAIKDSSSACLLSPDELGVNIDKNPIVAIRFQNHTPAAHMRLRFRTRDFPTWNADLSKAFDVTPDDTESRLYEIDLSEAQGGRGELKQLRLDFADNSPLTGTCRVDYIWIGRRK